MNIGDVFISKIRKIDMQAQQEILETVEESEIKNYILKIMEHGGIVILLDENGAYRDIVAVLNGLYSEIKRLGIGLIDHNYLDRPQDEDTNMEDFKLIGIGFVSNFAAKSIRKQALGLDLSLIDFLLDTSKTVDINKFILFKNEQILEHWSLKRDIRIFHERNFKFVLIKE